MENNARASNIQYKPSLIPKEPARAVAAAKQPSFKEKVDGKGVLYEASGLGLRLCAPKCTTSFVVECTAAQAAERRKLKVLCSMNIAAASLCW